MKDHTIVGGARFPYLIDILGRNNMYPKIVNGDRDDKGFYVLRRRCSDLYHRVQYQSKEDLIVNRIGEYDIRSANTTMLRRSRKVRSADLDAIEALPKHEREVMVGKMIRMNPSIQRTIAKGIIRAKRELFVANGIQTEEVQAIRNDAVFIIGRKLRTTTFGPVEFRLKHTFAAYCRIERLDIYYDQHNHTVSIKGVADEVLRHPDHIDGMLSFLARCMELLVYDRRQELRRHIIRFTDDYKSRKLPVNFYRELNKDNCYRTTFEVSGFSFNLDKVREDDKGDLNIAYNFNRYILPIIQRFI